MALVVAVLSTIGLPCVAQTNPSLHWRTISTDHFRVSFSDGLEDAARRAAGSAERAYAALARELHPPRGPISLVVADNLDVSNGYAVTFPSNRIVIYARPHVDAASLKFIDDWVDLVVVHELTHIFHLDRTRGLWRLGQYLFGRNPFLFPNAYSPSWLAEGIAVQYETKLTGAGRVVGTDFNAIARAHELGGTTPRANALSAGSPLYPLGNVAYAYGTPLVGAVINRGGPNGMRDFIDGNAAWLIPFMLNTNAKRAFGITFDSAYTLWADSIRREAQGTGPGAGQGPRAHEPLVRGGWFAMRPRWVGNDTIVWAGADPRSVPALRQVSAMGGAAHAIAERNTNDVNVPLPNGWRVFAQQEYVNPYTQRTDLWIERDGRAERITHGARLTHPDARLCGAQAASSQPGAGSAELCIVAVQLTPGAARLVHVRYANDNAELTPLTESSDANIWSEPRWSRDGTRIAATHWMRGGVSEIGILDATGRVLRTLGRSRAVNGAPAWGPGDSTIYFTSDRSGRSAIYRVNLNRTADALMRVAEAPTAFYESEPSPDGTRLATFQLREDGYDLTLVDANTGGTPADSSSVLPPSRGTLLARSDSAVHSYSAWRSVLPTYWLPTIEPADDNRYTYGLFTSGSDVIGRHAWSLKATVEPERAEPNFSASYAFAGLGTPVVQLGGDEFWDHFAIVDTADRPLGTLQRRKIIGDAALVFSRPRYRTAASLAVGGSYEWRDFLTDPAYLRSGIDPALRRQYTYPSFFVSAGFSNARTPYLALGPENGITLGATVRQRWRNGTADDIRATSVVLTGTAYRGLDFGGRIHHLLAVRGAYGTQDVTSATEFSAGGGSGSIVQLAPGLTFGDGRRTFFVRGFPGGVQTGNRAVATNVEYRFPIGFPARGLWKFPLYFQRVSGVLFSDAAAAWCSAGATNSPICRNPTPREWIGSGGIELHFDTAVQYDSPYRIRLGAATPSMGRKYFGKSNVVSYVTVGLPF